MGEQPASQAKDPYQDNRRSIRHSRKNNATAGSRQQMGQCAESLRPAANLGALSQTQLRVLWWFAGSGNGRDAIFQRRGSTCTIDIQSSEAPLKNE